MKNLSSRLKANLAAQCASKSKERDARSKLRAQEVQAISETIEMLNGDDALELFRKTCPRPPLLSRLRQRHIRMAPWSPSPWRRIA